MRRKKKNVVSAGNDAGNHDSCDCFGQAQSAVKKVFIVGSFTDSHPSFEPVIRLKDAEWATQAQRAFPLVVA